MEETTVSLQKVRPILILLAEDDDDDFELCAEAFEEFHLLNRVHRVTNGEELLDYLLQRGKFTDPAEAPHPSLILLDLNMPRKDGREALAEIKAHPKLRRIPVVVLTTSKAEEDILQSYNLGVSSFIRKPVTFEGLCEVVKAINHYWFEIVELPPYINGV